MSARIKICGLRDIDTIRSMDGLAVDEIGFIFAESRRKVSLELGAQLVNEAKKLQGANGLPPRTVGVFVNPDMTRLRELLSIVQLDVIQFHGEETPEMCRQAKEEFGAAVWKVFSIRGEERSSALERLLPYSGVMDAALIDTAGGGTGSAFDWSVIGHYQEAARSLGIPLYVAGGLHPGNVEELLRLYAPEGIDVSSGVETDGVKDIDKITRFVERVNAYHDSST
jgi:phosphoribosylanthranilate isomerase